MQVHPLFRRSRLFEACSVVDVVEQRLAEDEDADIAILVQGRSHLLHIVGELVRRGVPFQATDIDPLGERPIVLDLLALTRAIAHPADRPAWLAVLRAPWCGLTLAELHALCGDRRSATLPQLLRDDERRQRLEPDGPREARQALDRPGGCAGRAAAIRAARRRGARVARAGRPGHGRVCARARRSAGLFRRTRRAGTASHVVTWTSRRLAEALEKLYAPSRPDASIRVHLLTVHKAKGLEFDTVIVPGLERRSRADDKRLLQWARLPGASGRGLVVAPVAGKGDDPNPLYRWLEGLESGKLVQEKRRLLYVAATRAKRRLHLFGSCALKDGDGGGPTIVTPPSTVALGLLWPVLESDFRHGLQAQRRSKARRLRSSHATRCFDACRSRGPCRRSSLHESSHPADRGRQRSRRSSSTGRRRRRATSGPSFTANFCASPAAAPDASAGVSEPATMRRYHDELAELGVPADHRADAVERVATAVQRDARGRAGRWLLDQRHASADSELALTGRVNGELVSVVIDRTFVDGQGTRWIVDYKTSSHEGAGLEAFLDREQQRYSAAARALRGAGPAPRSGAGSAGAVFPAAVGLAGLVLERPAHAERSTAARVRADPDIPASEPGPAARRPGRPPCPRARNCARQRVSMRHRPLSDRSCRPRVH